METRLQGNPFPCKKAAGRERAQGMAKLRLQKANGGYKYRSLLIWDAERRALGCKMVLKGGWVQARL